MSDTRWYADRSAALFYERFKKQLEPLLVDVAPHHELTSIGLFPDDINQEVKIVLHLAPIGTVRVVPDTSPETKTLLERK